MGPVHLQYSHTILQAKCLAKYIPGLSPGLGPGLGPGPGPVIFLVPTLVPVPVIISGPVAQCALDTHFYKIIVRITQIQTYVICRIILNLIVF